MTGSIAHYRLLELIGSGGVGEVYLALDQRTSARVALKLIPLDVDRELLESERRGAELQREIHRFAPAAVAEVYDVDESDGYLYIAMEYIGGESLSAVLEQRGALGEPLALKLAVQLAALLEQLHTAAGKVSELQGPLVHGDVKPQNIRIQGTRLRLLDFGLAQRLRDAYSPAVSDYGSISYISPQRLRDGHLTPEDDLWAAGVVLFQMLSGRLPFPGDSVEAIRQRIETAQGPAPLPEEVRPALRRIVARCLSMDPARRYPSARALKHALKAELRDPKEEAGKTRRVRSTKKSRTPSDRPSSPRPRVASPESRAAANSSSRGASRGSKPARSRKPRRWIIWVGVFILCLGFVEAFAVAAGSEIEEQIPQTSDLEALATRYLHVRWFDPLGLIADVGERLEEEILVWSRATIRAAREGADLDRETWNVAVTRLALARKIDGDDDEEHAKYLYCEGQALRTSALQAVAEGQDTRAKSSRALARRHFEKASRVAMAWHVPALAIVELELLAPLGEPDLATLDGALHTAEARGSQLTATERRLLIRGHEELGRHKERAADRAHDSREESRKLFEARSHFEQAAEQCERLTELTPPCRARSRTHLDRLSRRLRSLGYLS